MMGMQHLFQLDHSLSAWVVAHRWYPLTGVMEIVTTAGRDGLLWGAIGAILAVAGRLDVRGLLQLWAALALALVVSDHIVKPIAARERPFRSNPAITVIGHRSHDSSFPSGHTAAAFAGAFALSRFAPGGRLIWWTTAVAIAYSRVYLGEHYPLDVAIGAAIGLCSAALLGWAFGRVHFAGGGAGVPAGG